MDDTRPEPPMTGDGLATLRGFLDFQRATRQMKCAGMDADQLARRAVEPSSLSLLRLVRHLADVERSWFHHFAGEVTEPIFYTRAEPDLDIHGARADPGDVDTAFDRWRTECAHSDEIIAAAPLERTFFRPRHGGETISLRWILVHMIEEYSRHNGHADLLRERLDGSTGE